MNYCYLKKNLHWNLNNIQTTPRKKNHKGSRRGIQFEFLFLSVMATDKAIDSFLKKQRRESDIWKQNVIPLQVKQEKPSCSQAGPYQGRDPRLQKRPRLEIQVDTSSPLNERTVRQVETQTAILIDLTLDEPWIMPSENRPKIWDQEQLTKNLVTNAEHDILNILTSKGESDINLTDSRVDQIRGALTKLALQSQSIMTKYNF
jgi:hypothetical protein